MNLITWILFGIILGVITYIFKPQTRDHGENDLFISLGVGVTGAVVGGVISLLMFGISITGFNMVSFLLAVYVSLIILFIGKSLRSL